MDGRIAGIDGNEMWSISQKAMATTITSAMSWMMNKSI